MIRGRAEGVRGLNPLLDLFSPTFAAFDPQGEKKLLADDERPLPIQMRLIADGIAFGEEESHFRVGIRIERY